MVGRNWERLAAAGGIVFVVLQNVSQGLIQVGGLEPPFAAPPEAISAFFLARNRQLFDAGMYLSTLSMIAFMWFLGALWAALRRQAAGPGWPALVAVGSGFTAVAASLGTNGWALAMFRIDAGLDPQLARFLFDLGNFGFATFWVSLASMLLAVGAAAQGGALPRWLGWSALAIAAGLLVARAFWAASGVAFMPYILFWLWLIAASVVLMRRAGAAA